MANNKIYIKIWNPDTNEDEWREFNTSEIDELMEQEIIDTDTLGWAMKDSQALSDAIDFVSQNSPRGFTFEAIVDKYIEMTGQEIRIE